MFERHPRAMKNLFFTEMWERFGFYIMSAVYVLYMDKDLHFADEHKATLYGLFLFGSYLFPIVGGYLGDKVLGQIRTVRLGASMMALGYFFLALSSLDRLFLFYSGLALIASGTGIFKVNMSVLVGNLYRDKQDLKDAGYNIYYMGVNLGATIAPLVATVLGAVYNDYHMSFWAAALGMVIALVVLKIGEKGLRVADTHQSAEMAKHNADNEGDPAEFWPRIITLGILFFIAAFFWIPFYQNGLALTLFADRSTLEFQFLRPETYQTFNPVFILLLTPPLLWLFSRLNRVKKEPATPVKIFLGLVIMGFAMLLMALASQQGGNLDEKIMSPLWLIGTYFIITLGEILISPMGLSYVSKVAPKKVQGIVMSGWYLSTAVGSGSSGIFGRLYSEISHDQYFLILAGFSFFAAVLVLVFMKKLNRFSAG